MTTKYTPGPWEYNWNATRWVIDSAPAHAIACTAGYEPENEANARLIAAAPELVEALRELMDDLEAEIEARRGSVLLRTTERDLAPVRKARALLARIEG